MKEKIENLIKEYEKTISKIVFKNLDEVEFSMNSVHENVLSDVISDLKKILKN